MNWFIQVFMNENYTCVNLVYMKSIPFLTHLHNAFNKNLYIRSHLEFVGGSIEFMYLRSLN